MRRSIPLPARGFRIPALSLALLAAVAAGGPAASGHEEGSEAGATPPVVDFDFEVPRPGSYELPRIDRVSEAVLTASDGSPAPLLGLAPGQIAFVAFVYSKCTAGCPAALAALQRLDRLLAADDRTAERVRLTAVSFDPEHDTPAVMARLREALEPRGDWRFLTAVEAERLAPVLTDFGQDALRLVDADGADLTLFRHVLKVFLVDDGGGVRNVYSAGFLFPELMLADARTLLAEAPAAPPARR